MMAHIACVAPMAPIIIGPLKVAGSARNEARAPEWVPRGPSPNTTVPLFAPSPRHASAICEW
eukprot:scaffold150416_cov30-Tisochrysis_lutea.AAC.1